MKTTTDMPDEMIDLVADNTSQAVLRAELEENLEKTHMTLIDALVFQVHYSLDHDSTNSYGMSNDLYDMESILGNWIKIDQLVVQNRLQEAEDLALSTRDHIYFTKEDIRDEADAMDMWLAVIENNSQLENLSGGDLNTIQYLQANYYFTTAGKKAASVLREYYHEEHFTPAYYQNSSATPRSLPLNSISVSEIQLMTVYPNPAGDYLIVTWNKYGVQPMSIVLSDISGRTLHCTKASDQQTQIILDTTTLANGVYSLSLVSGDNVIDTSKVEISH